MRVFEYDTSATIFWRAMIERSEERLTTYLRSHYADGGRFLDAPTNIARLRAIMELSTYCRKRYWAAFYAARGV
jgi:hypothetical protein